MIPFSQKDHRITGNIHGTKLILFIQRLRVPAVVQMSKRFPYLLLIVQKPPLINVFGTHGMPRTSLFHKFSKNTTSIGFLPLRSHFFQYPMPDGTSLPERDHFLFLKPIVLFTYLKADQLPVIHHMEILYCMAA